MRLLGKILHQVRETFAFTFGLLADLALGARKPRAGARRVAIVTREDLFPANHGGAVKIVQTARHLSFLYEEVLVITQSRYDYLVFRNGECSEHPYPHVARWLFWRPFSRLRHQLETTGFPASEQFLARPVCDRNFKFRVLFLAVRRPFEVMQAEFAPFVFACDWASRVYPDLPRITVEHNIEFHRIGSTYNLSPAATAQMKRIEIGACRSSDRVVAVSEVDRDQLIRDGVEASRMAVIPLGVDLAEYRSIDTRTTGSIRQEYGLADDFVIMFHGVLHYKPNREAVTLLAQEIMPRLRSWGCAVKCLVVGSTPPSELAADDIIMTGPVDRLPPFIQVADAAVIPLLEGGGTRLKILEYFAAGIPVISTAKGAEGIHAESGRDIMIEDTMEGIARLVSELQRDAAKRRAVGESGRRFVQDFGWDHLATAYSRLYADVRRSKE